MIKKTSKRKTLQGKNKKTTMKGGYSQPFLYVHTAPPYNYVDNIGTVSQPIPGPGYSTLTNLSSKGGNRKSNKNKKSKKNKNKKQ